MRTSVLLALILLSATGLRASGGDDQKPFTLTTLLGETFQHCRIIKATPEGVTVSHDNGVSKIPFENLNDEWKKMFHYSPDKAREFQKEEASRRELAEKKRRQVQKEYEKNETARMSELAAAENRRLTWFEEVIAHQQVEAAAATAAAVASQPGLLVPLPGDPTPFLGAGAVASRTATTGSAGTAVQSTTEVIVPSTTPITQVYTPGTTGGQRYIINQGAVFTPGDGSIYYINPGYVNPGYVIPGCTNPPIVIYPQGPARTVVPARPGPNIMVPNLVTPNLMTPGASGKVSPGAIRVRP